MIPKLLTLVAPCWRQEDCKYYHEIYDHCIDCIVFDEKQYPIHLLTNQNAKRLYF